MPKKKKEDSRYIPLRNYYIAAFVFLGIIFLTLYIFKWYEVKQSEKYRLSYLVSTQTVSLEINEENELKQVFLEAPEEYFVYIGYRNDKDVYNVEKKLKPVIEKYDLKNIFYYVDATDLKEKDGYIDMLNKTLKLDKEKIDKIPTIIYFKENNYEIINIDGFTNLLNKEGFEKIAR